MKTLERAGDALLDKDWGAKVPDYITKGTFSVAVFFMSLTMRGENPEIGKINVKAILRRLADVPRPLLEIPGTSSQLLPAVRSDQ